MPAEEMPSRPYTMTPPEKVNEVKDPKQQVAAYIESDIECNKNLNNKFILHEDAIIKLHVAPEHEDKLFVKQYKIPQVLWNPLRECLAKWASNDKVIDAPEGCKFNSPLLCAPKFDKDGNVKGVRVCLDVRQLNKYLIEDDKFKIPYIRDILEKFAKCKYYGEFDLTEAYFQFMVHEDSRKYLAFTFENKQYVFKGCPFGLKHIPSVFQRFMTKIFADLTFVYPYIDNLPFGSMSLAEHCMHAKLIVQRLNKYGIKLNLKEMNLANTEIRILGFKLDEQGMYIDPNKQKIIADWPVPYSGAELSAFIGLVTFLRDHIRHVTELEAPLISLRKQTIIKWDENTLHCFNILKSAIAKAPFLAYPDYNKAFYIASDVSKIGVGGVVYQPTDEEGTITPFNIIAVYSKKLTMSQQGYPVYKKELWGLVYCLRKAHAYIWGRNDTVVYVDHKPLIFILTQRQLSVALQQWLDVILNYNLKIKYRPGIQHIIPDALSRLYGQAYVNDEVWGLKNGIQLLEVAQTELSPTDRLCIDSIATEMHKQTKKTKNIYLIS